MVMASSSRNAGVEVKPGQRPDPTEKQNRPVPSPLQCDFLTASEWAGGLVRSRPLRLAQGRRNPAAEKRGRAVILSDAKDACIRIFKPLQRPFLRFTQDRLRLLRMTAREIFPEPDRGRLKRRGTGIIH